MKVSSIPSGWSLWLVALFMCLSWSIVEAKPNKKRRGKKSGKGKQQKAPPAPAPTPDPPEALPAPEPAEENAAPDPVDRAKPKGPDQIAAGESVPLHEGPGDGFQSKRKLVAGTSVTVIKRSGRWAQVKVGKSQGWILERSLKSYTPRSGQAESKDETPGEPSWGKGKVEGKTDQQFVVEIAGEGGELRATSDSQAESLTRLAAGDRVLVLAQSADRKWMQVRDNSGAEGWIERDRVQSNIAAGFGPNAGKVEFAAQHDAAEERKREAMPRLAVRNSLGIGYRSLSMDFSSAGDGVLANTIVETQAMVAAGASEIVLRSASRKMHAGVDGRLRLSYSRPGIEVRRSGEVLGDVDFSILEWNLGLRAGMALGQDFEIGLRGGLRYDVFYPKNVDNPGLLPRESLLAYTAGARVEWLRFLPDVVVSLDFEALVSGKRKQTAGLQDGTDTSVGGYWAGLRSEYRIGEQLDLFASFLYGWARSEWTGPSQRNPDVMNSSRTDATQTIQFGLAHRF